MEKVTVQGFRKYAVPPDENVASRLKATAETIKSIGAEPILGTEEEVDASQLVGNGMYDPSPLTSPPSDTR